MKKCIGHIGLIWLIAWSALAAPPWVWMMPTASAAPADITNGLVAWYLLSGNVNDSSSSGFNGTAVGSPTYTTGQDGIANHAIELNGSSQYVSCNNSVFSDSSTAWTFTAWEKSSSDVPLFGRGEDGNGTGWSIRLYTSAFASIVTASPVSQFTLTTSSATSGWQFVALVFDGSELSYYTNHVLNASIAASGTGLRSSTVGMCFGFSPEDGAYANAFLQDVRFYSRALSTGELSTLNANGARSASNP